MKRVLLLAVYTEKMMDMYEELGICYISSYLREHGYEVMLMSTQENLCDYKKIIDFTPEIIGLSVYNISRWAVYRTIDEISKILPDTYICVGGYLPTYRGKEMMEENNNIDFAVRGEGEETFYELLLKLAGKEPLHEVDGLIFRDKDEIVINKQRQLIDDINKIPSPSRDILVDKKFNIAQISTSRGCKAKCSFCASQLFWNKWRGIDSKSVVDEIEKIVSEYGIRLFNFIDNSFEDPGENYERLYSITSQIIERNLEISYFADFRAEFHKKANSELMMLLKDSGLCGICLGVESGNEADLKLYRKIATIEDIENVIQLFRKFDINVEPGFICFNPYSSIEGLKKNINFLEKYGFASNFDYIVSKYKRYDGTYLDRKIKEDKLLLPYDSTEEDYMFLNENVKILADYIKNYYNAVNKCTNNALDKISYFSVKFVTLLKYLKRQCNLSNKSNSYHMVEEFEENNKNLCLNLNKNVAEWFRSLIYLAEKQWDEKEADLISSQLLSKEKVLSATATLEKNKINLFKNLIKDGVEIIRIY